VLLSSSTIGIRGRRSQALGETAYWPCAACSRDHETRGGGRPTGFLSRLLGRPETGERTKQEPEGGRPEALQEEENAASAPEPEGPSVVAYLKLSDAELTNDREQMRLFALEDRLMRAIDASGAGTYEGNYLDRGFLRLYASGPDADRLAAVIRPLLEGAPPGSVLVKRNGPPGADEERIPL
jgi:hypothetical protein